MFRPGNFYQFFDCDEEADKYLCSQRLSNGFVFKRISKDFTPYANEGFIMTTEETGEYWNGRVPTNCKQIYREMNVDQKKEFFKLAFKIAKCGDIDGNLSGYDSDVIHNFEFEYNVFSKLWNLPREEEKEWLENLDSNPYSTAGVPEEVWFEDEEIIGQALLKIRMVKQYIAEMKVEDTPG